MLRKEGSSQALGERIGQVERGTDLGQKQDATRNELTKMKDASVDMLTPVERANGTRHVDGTLIVLIERGRPRLRKPNPIAHLTEILNFTSGQRGCIELCLR